MSGGSPLNLSTDKQPYASLVFLLPKRQHDSCYFYLILTWVSIQAAVKSLLQRGKKEKCNHFYDLFTFFCAVIIQLEAKDSFLWTSGCKSAHKNVN